MSTMAAPFRESILERRFRFAEHGTTLARDTMAGLTTFIVMSYIIFLNPIILTSVKPKTGAPLPFEGVVTATCVVAAVMTILMRSGEMKGWTHLRKMRSTSRYQRAPTQSVSSGRVF